MHKITRRRFSQTLGLSLLPAAIAPVRVNANPAPIAKKVPSSGEMINPIGMGTWQTFNVGTDTELRDARTEVLKTFFDLGGRMVDSSPMYGSSQDVMGYALEKLNSPAALFSAEKVWTSDGDATRTQIAQTADKWGVKNFDLIQIHNLLSWEDHLETLTRMKEDGEVRYIGITTSHGRRHRDLENILATRKLDFVQLTYNTVDRDVEDRLLPIAQERGIAVIVNRPFQGGRLVDRLQRRNAPLPDWAPDYHCANWPQLLLKFVISHPAVTCAIPATTKVEHMQENMGAARGPLLDAKSRAALLSHMNNI